MATIKVCRTCGNDDVWQDAYVSLNTGEVAATFDYFYCNSCDGDCAVVEKEKGA